MSTPGTPDQPLRVAIVGSGPAGFYAAEHLFKRGPHVRVDMYDRLPTPFGLVRFGVAPDHQKIKTVTRVFEKIAARPEFRFYGNVDIGTHLTLDDLRAHYHAVCFTTGAQTDRRMGIPGEDLANSHPATEFVAWYNGHPDYRDATFDLTAERVAVVGVGNVAVDVARVLCRTVDELAQTDIADYALEQLRESRVKEVYMLGRRGPAQAAFTNAEVRELGELPGADLLVRPDEVALDPLSRAWVEAQDDRTLNKKVDILAGFADRRPGDKPRRLTLRFLVSPVALTDDDTGRVTGIRLVKNELYADERGGLRPRATGEEEHLPVELVFRSVGYRGVALPDVPFHDAWGVVPNEQGRVIDDAQVVPGVYVAGWIKRGPSGVIGSNKPCAAETAGALLSDLVSGDLPHPEVTDPDAIETVVRAKQPDVLTYDDWRRLDAAETARGEAAGRPRVKFTSVGEMRDYLATT